MKKTRVAFAIAFASTLALQPLAASSKNQRPDQYPGRQHALRLEKSVGKTAVRKDTSSGKEPLALASAQLAQGDGGDAAGGGTEKDDSIGGLKNNSDNVAKSNDSDNAAKSNDSDEGDKNDDSDDQDSKKSDPPSQSDTDTRGDNSSPSDSSSSQSDSGSLPKNSGSSPASGSSQSGVKPNDSASLPKDSSSSQPQETSQEPDDTKVLQDSTTDPKWKLSIEKGQEQLNSGNLGGAVSYFSKALKAAQRLDNNDRILELNYRKLGQAYYQKEDFAKAYDSLSSGMTLCEKLGIRDSLLEDAITKVSSNYKTIEMTIFPDDIVKQMRNAGVQKITVAKQDAGHLITFDLADKYTKAIGNDDVSDMGFARKVSFQFLEKDGESWQISAMKGLTAKAKGMWVNLMATMLSGGGGTPKAEVTAGKMGIQKTVNVDLPNDIYGTARGILMNLSKAIQSPPVFARTGLPRSD